jgi:hypothetical protein
MTISEPRSGPKLKNSLLISLLAGNFAVETGSRSTAATTTQFARSLIPETLREKPALARPIRRVVLAVRSPPGGICRIQGPVSGQKNPVPGAVLASEEVFMAPARTSHIAATIRPARRAGSRCRPHGAGAPRLQPAPGSAPGTPARSSYLPDERCSFRW